MKFTSSHFTTHLRLGGVLAVFAFITSGVRAADPSPEPPDLTKGGEIQRDNTYNLGATGLRGYIYTRATNMFESVQGRTTTRSRQILVSHVGAKSPADGVMQVDDVILGTGGKLFSDDARKSIAFAIQESEKEENNGILKLTVWRAGKTSDVELKLNVMGTYSATAPYNCPKSKRIFDAACKALEKENLEDNWHGAINGLALLATGRSEYLPVVTELAHKMGPATLDIQHKTNGPTWDLAYRNIFLCEYFLLTGDKEVRHAINEITLSLARGQGMYGTFGHGFSERRADGKLHGSVPPYGPVNSAGLAANISIVMGRKCGVKDPEVEAAIERASKFFGYFIDKGAIPYGEHEPWPYHGSNGKTAMAAVFFGIQGSHVPETRFFSRMATAAYANRQYGHTGQGFCYLWGALGANVGGPAAAAEYFEQTSWQFDLARRCDGTFTYDGGEQYGGGKTDDNTYYGNSSYFGLSPNAYYVLSYSLPLKKLLITGRDANQANWLTDPEAAQAVASGRFDLDRKNMTPAQLVAAFRDWSPIVRGWAAQELATRPDTKSMVPELIKLAEGKDVHAAQGACEALGLINSVEALPVIVRLLSHQDRWLRYKAAAAIRAMGGDAKPALPSILAAVAKTTEPLVPINWADPIQLAHGQLSAALFKGPLAGSVKDSDRELLYPAVRAVSTNADGMARADLRGFFENMLSAEDIQALAPDILRAVETKSPADQMFSNEIRMGGFKALTKYHFKEGIEAGVEFAKTQGGHGSERRTGEIMKTIETYGKAAQPVIPQLKELIAMLNEQANSGGFPVDLNKQRVDAVEDAIKSIEAATTQPELRSISAAR